jgi:hypothetical protein
MGASIPITDPSNYFAMDAEMDLTATEEVKKDFLVKERVLTSRSNKPVGVFTTFRLYETVSRAREVVLIGSWVIIREIRTHGNEIVRIESMNFFNKTLRQLRTVVVDTEAILPKIN